MKQSNRLIIVIVILAALLLVACGQQPEAEVKEEPAVVELIEGTELNRVTLTPRAAERLGIQTTQVREQTVSRQRTVGGLVEAPAEGTDSANLARIRVALNSTDFEQVARNQPVQVLALDDDEDDADEMGLEALEVEELDDVNDIEDDLTDEPDYVLYYQVDNANQSLAAGERVGVRFNMAGSGEQRVVVPDSAVIYDLQGATWVYVSPEPLVFHRAPVTIDYIHDGLAVLSDGPALGTEIAIVGVAELYGADTGVGK
jgi:hypothetical protein